MRKSTPPRSLKRGVSPPASKRRRLEDAPLTERPQTTPRHTDSAYPTPAAVEAGQATVRDHLSYFTDQLTRCNRYDSDEVPGSSAAEHGLRLPAVNAATTHLKHLSILNYRELYVRNANKSAGCHFVVHQHDHPRAGTHYDLRLQINKDSSCSWAIPYGLPGNPNESRHGRRQAIETRVHSLWNHLIEAASHQTGSMLIWDTGEYEVLPFEDSKDPETEDESSGRSAGESHGHVTNDELSSESDRLSEAFRAGKIRLRLHGTRLPRGYTISLRLSHNAREKISGRPDPTRQATRQDGVRRKRRIKRRPRAPQTSDEDTDGDAEYLNRNTTQLNSDADDDPEYQALRANNAYTGARNTVNSVHQRWWFVAMDKPACGFVKGKNHKGHVSWSPSDDLARQMYPFFVRGRDYEMSIVTGRKAAEVLMDEGVENYVFRSGWQPILN